MPLYRKKQLQEMTHWTPGTDMSGVSVSDADKVNGSPKDGDVIATNPLDPSDRWLVAHKFFVENYEVTTMEQTTISEINAALNEYFEVFDIAGARSAALQNTVALRKAQTTWAWKEEHDFMFKIDRFLDEHCKSWRGV